MLGGDRPAELIGMVRHLTLLQADQAAAVAPSADLVAWSRLGSSYSPADLAAALRDRTLVELRGLIRPAEDMALYTAEMAEWPGSGPLPDWREDTLRWVDANDKCRLDILDRLGSDAPLPMRNLPDTCAVPWQSTGWTNNRNVSVLLDFMVRRGEVAMAGWRGRDRLWDLAERVYPDDPMVPVDQARAIRAQRRLRALGIARAHGPECPVEPSDVGEAGEPAVVEGVQGEWRVDPAQLGQPFSGRAALLSPLDRLVYDRKRMTELFGSTTSWRCTNPPPSAAGATGRCRSCPATGWWASWTPPPTAPTTCSGSTRSTRTCRSAGPPPLPFTRRSGR